MIIFVLLLWECFCSPPILYSAGSVRKKIFSLHSDGEKFSGLVIFQMIISSRCWTWCYLALLPFFWFYRLCISQHSVSLTRHFFLQRAEIVYPGGNLIISPKVCNFLICKECGPSRHCYQAWQAASLFLSCTCVAKPASGILIPAVSCTKW